MASSRPSYSWSWSNVPATYLAFSNSRLRTASSGERREYWRTALIAMSRNSSSVISLREIPTRLKRSGSAPSCARLYSAGSSLRLARSPVAPKIARFVGWTGRRSRPSARGLSDRILVDMAGSPRSVHRLRRTLARRDVGMVRVQDRVDLAGQPHLGEREACVMEIRDREPDAVETRDAHVGPPLVVDSGVGDPLDQAQRVLEVAHLQLTDDRVPIAAPAGPLLQRPRQLGVGQQPAGRLHRSGPGARVGLVHAHCCRTAAALRKAAGRRRP